MTPANAQTAPAIVARGLGKRYVARRETNAHWAESVFGRFYGATRGRRFWALRDCGFDLAPGAFVGVIGPNGSGKSTLLKMLAGIVKPTEGDCAVRGRVGALLEVGVGFHPDLSGWENIFLYGSILGVPRAEIRARLGDIVAFAEIEERLLDMPLKYYSSGMYARLGFSVAVHTEPDVLLVDEILSVGDARFQTKSFERIVRMAGEGRTVVFVTHNLPLAREVCREMILLREGRLVARGEPRDVVAAHQRHMTDQMLRLMYGATEDGAAAPAAELVEARAFVPNDAGVEGAALRTGAPGAIAARARFDRDVADAQFVACLVSDDGVIVSEIDSREADGESGGDGPRPVRRGQTADLRVEFDTMWLRDGAYSLALLLFDGPGRDRVLAAFPEALEFRVVEDTPHNLAPLFELSARWSLERAANANR